MNLHFAIRASFPQLKIGILQPPRVIFLELEIPVNVARFVLGSDVAIWMGNRTVKAANRVCTVCADTDEVTFDESMLLLLLACTVEFASDSIARTFGGST